MKRIDRMHDMAEQLYKIYKNLNPTICNELEIRAMLVTTAASHQIPAHYYDERGRKKEVTF